MHPLFPRIVGYPLQSKPLQTLSPIALAYLGDAVYELYFRTQYLLPSARIRDYHQRVVACVRAETQASFVKALLPHLSATELQILKQGRNAATGRPKRLALEVYQQATALETLVGYLYLTDIDRLQEILGYFSFEDFAAMAPQTDKVHE
ncbi:MAG: ribonuclease III domain-containing protein [Thermosynechococcaceae cyanobacterium]